MGKESGELKSDVRYIRETMERIEKSLGEDINHLEGRVDEISRHARGRRRRRPPGLWNPPRAPTTGTTKYDRYNNKEERQT